MNVLNKFTLDNIKKNKKRTIVTVIGVALSTALICAVAGMIMSFQQTLVNMVKITTGNYHTNYQNISADQIKYIDNNIGIESYFYTKNIGYARLNNSQNDYKPYINVISFDKKALLNNGLKITSGRMPENENEIVISEHILTNARVKYNIGDTLTLDIGTRVDSNGKQLYQDTEYNETNYNTKTNSDSTKVEDTKSQNEQIINTNKKTYVIVGIIERPSDLIENYSAPGYTAITYLNDDEVYSAKKTNNANERFNVSVNYKIAKDFSKVESQIIETIKNNTEETVKAINNKDLLEYEGALSEVLLKTLYSIGTIVIGIIVVSSIFVIRNSFSISVSEKTKQYGMLASIGATTKQIRKSVLFEGFIIGIIGVPLGIICGITAILILIQLLNYLLADMLNGINFVYSIPMSVIGITILLSTVTIYLSCLLPAIRAAKISPIEAIRGNNDVKIKPKKVKTSKLAKKIFGIGGTIASKNLKRSKKKYRTTVISLVVSISIFIILSSFLQYGKQMTGIYYSELNYNISIDGLNNSDYKEILKLDGAEDYLYANTNSYTAKIDVEKYGTEFAKNVNSKNKQKEEKDQQKLTQNDNLKDNYLDATIISINKESFETFAKSLDIKTDNYNKIAILEDDMIKYNSNNSKSIENYYNISNGESIEIELEHDGNVSQENIVITKKSNKRPMGFEQRYIDGGIIFVSEDYFDNKNENSENTGTLFIKSSNPNETENTIIDLKKSNDKFSTILVTNIYKYSKQNERMILVISIFLYGFITVITLIGITNIFNTITTNMILRSKEFAMLKSIGMTKKEFNKMIRLESLMYGLKSLIIGIPIGLLGSYEMYKSFANDFDFGYIIPWESIIISIIFVFIIVGVTMKYSLNKINKQNIVETIRNDNI